MLRKPLVVRIMIKFFLVLSMMAVVQQHGAVGVLANAEEYWERDGWEKDIDYLNTEHSIIFGLNFPIDTERLGSISDPDSPNFRKFLTLEETRAMQMTSGLEDCRNAVEKFVEETSSSTGGGGLTFDYKTPFHEYLTITGNWSSILSLFEPGSLELVEFHRKEEEFRHSLARAVPVVPDTDIVDLLVKNRTLPECIGGIYRLTDFPIRSRPRIRYDDDKDSSGGDNSDGRLLKECKKQNPKSNRISPQVLFDMYAVPSNAVNGLPSSTANVQIIYEGTSEKVSESDLTCFASSFDLDTNVALTGNYQKFNTGACGNSCGEPNLDAQYLAAMNQGVDVNYQAYSNMDTLFTTLKSLPDDELPIVVSISYGIAESKSYKSSLKQMCSEIQSLTARGVTFFASTGDTGATNSGKEGTCGKGYNVNFPASCPYVVAVGGTTGFAKGEEIVCNAGKSVITTGGGFSEIFTTTNYNLDFQKAQVDGYLSQVGSSSSIQDGYPTNGRGLPDISAAATSYEIILSDKVGVVDGTSASCPVMAGITARVALENGGQRFGNINKLLYNASNAEIWFDVKSGQNSGNGKQENCPSNGGSIQGFEAAEGWDPATGLGTLGTGIGYSDYSDLLTLAPPPSPPPVSGARSAEQSFLFAIMSFSLAVSFLPYF